jgi:Rps23 Pro-64 3,4-dihydroxylase Tpa1-like proline 4-hydroxylase
MKRRVGPCCVALPEFLTARELAELRDFVLSRESQFQASYVVAPGGSNEVVVPDHRRSKVLFDTGRFGRLVTDRILFHLPFIMRKLGRSAFRVTDREAQITATNDGDFFGLHADNSEPPYEQRELSFVYYFHAEPKPFTGGQLRLYRPEAYDPKQYETIVPEQNTIVLFPSSLLHKVLPVKCPSRAFADSRFTLNGWFHR